MQGYDRVLSGCLAPARALHVSGDVHGRMPTQSAASLSLRTARRKGEEQSGAVSEREFQHGQTCTLPAVLHDAASVLWITEGVCGH